MGKSHFEPDKCGIKIEQKFLEKILKFRILETSSDGEIHFWSSFTRFFKHQVWDTL